MTEHTTAPVPRMDEIIPALSLVAELVARLHREARIDHRGDEHPPVGEHLRVARMLEALDARDGDRPLAHDAAIAVRSMDRHPAARNLDEATRVSNALALSLNCSVTELSVRMITVTRESQ